MKKGKHKLKVLNLCDKLEESNNSSNNDKAERNSSIYDNANHMYIPTMHNENSYDSIVNNSQQQQDLEEGINIEDIEESDYNVGNTFDDKILLPNITPHNSNNKVTIAMEKSDDESIVENSLDPDEIINESFEVMNDKTTKRRGKYKKRNAVNTKKRYIQTSSINKNKTDWMQSKGRNTLNRKIFIKTNGNNTKSKKKSTRQKQQNIRQMFGGNCNSNTVCHVTQTKNKRKRKPSKLSLNESARKGQRTSTLDKYIRKMPG
eukprot:g6204.t1